MNTSLVILVPWASVPEGVGTAWIQSCSYDDMLCVIRHFYQPLPDAYHALSLKPIYVTLA